VGGAVDAGRVVRLDYRYSDEPDALVVEQGRSGAGKPEPHDRFGEVLELMPTGKGTILMVGIPREDVGSRVDAGAVGMMPAFGTLSLVTQDSPGAGDKAQAGDRYGAPIDSYVTVTTDPYAVIGVVVVGVPGEDVAGTRNAGMVSFASFDLGLSSPEEQVSPISGWSRTLTQGSPGIRGEVERGDRYGSSVLAGEFGTDSARLHLVATAPKEDLGRTSNAGLLAMTLIHPDGPPEAGTQPGVLDPGLTGCRRSSRGRRPLRVGAQLRSADHGGGRRRRRVVGDDGDGARRGRRRSAQCRHWLPRSGSWSPLCPPRATSPATRRRT
jgi:hypothetical protein